MKKNYKTLKIALLISIFALLLITALFVVSGIPTGKTIDFILEVPEGGLQQGEQFEALFKITTPDIEEFNLAGFQAEIKFDSALFEIVEVEDLSSDNTIASFNTTGSTVEYICINDFLSTTEGYKTFGHIFSVTLKAKEAISKTSEMISTNDFTLLLGDYNSKSISDYTIAVNSVAPTVMGDLNGDKKVTTSDAVYLLYNTIHGDVKYPVDQDCDFDNSGSVDSNDAIYLLYHVIFGAQKYPLN